jgi:hypothetical protein
VRAGISPASNHHGLPSKAAFQSQPLPRCSAEGLALLGAERFHAAEMAMAVEPDILELTARSGHRHFRSPVDVVASIATEQELERALQAGKAAKRASTSAMRGRAAHRSSRGAAVPDRHTRSRGSRPRGRAACRCEDSHALNSLRCG